MSLPVSDNFTGVNGQELSAHSSNWVTTLGNFFLQANAVAPGANSGDCLAVWAANSFADDQYAQALILSISNAGGWVGVAVRCSQNGAFGYVYTGSVYGSELGVFWDGGYRIIASGNGFSSGDMIRLEANGSTLTPYKNGIIDASIGIHTETDLPSGLVGINGYGGDGSNWSTLDNWEGGNLSNGSINASLTLPALGTFGQTKSATVQVIRSASVVIQPIPISGRPGLFAVSTTINRLIPLAAVGAEARLSSGLVNTSENISVLLTKVGLSGQPGLLTASPSINSVVTLPAVGAIADSISCRANTFQSASIRLEALGSWSSLPPERVLASTNIQIALPSSLAAGYFSLPAALTTANADIKMAGLGVGALLAISNVSISRVVEIVPVGSMAAVGNAILSNAVNVAIPLVPVSAIAQNSPLSIEAVAYAMIELDQVGAIVHPSPLNVLAFQEGDPIFTLLFSLATRAMLISVEPKWQLSLRLTSNRLEL